MEIRAGKSESGDTTHTAPRIVPIKRAPNLGNENEVEGTRCGDDRENRVRVVRRRRVVHCTASGRGGGRRDEARITQVLVHLFHAPSLLLYWSPEVRYRKVQIQGELEFIGASPGLSYRPRYSRGRPVRCCQSSHIDLAAVSQI